MTSGQFETSEAVGSEIQIQDREFEDSKGPGQEKRLDDLH